jgi:hypothetical protein
MNKLTVAFAALALLLKFAPAVHAQDAFQRPDCTAFQAMPEPEATCFRKTKIALFYANADALQKTGLEFLYMGRPDAEDSPEAKKVLEDKTEGAFLIRYSVQVDGTVHDVRIDEASSDAIRHLAKLWADAIAQWKFAKIEKPVKDVPFGRIYLYSAQDDDRRTRRAGS